MTTIPKEAISAAGTKHRAAIDAAVAAIKGQRVGASRLYEFASDMEMREIADQALLAALPHIAPAVEVGVKPLHWRAPCRETNGTWEAKTPFGTYYVVNEDGWHAGIEDNLVDRFEWSGTKDPADEARAFEAVNADYKRRARMVISDTPPALDPVRDKLVEALKVSQQAVKLLHELCSCRGDDEYVLGVQRQIDAALAAASASEKPNSSEGGN